MEFTRLDGRDAGVLAEFWELDAVVRAHDRPGFPPLQRKLAERNIADQRPDVRNEYHLAWVDGRLAGFAWLLLPVRDNEHLLYLNVTVHPGLRRRGIGSALLDLALRRGAEAKRSTVIGRTAEPLPGGPRRDVGGREFLLAKGFEVARSMWDWRVDLAAIDGKLETDLFEEARQHAWEYELIGWTGPTPEEQLPAVAVLHAGFSAQAPSGDLATGPKAVDVERQRAAEAMHADCGVTEVSSFARHTATGELVGYSTILVESDSPNDSFQAATLVQPEHRGHRLGTILKLDNHRRLRRGFPQVRTLWTSVAEVNTHMLAVNQQLGYTEVDRQLDFQREI